MESKPPLRKEAYAYIVGVIVAGVFVTGQSALELTLKPVSNQWLILAGLTLLTGSFSVKIPSIGARISVSEAFVFASVLLFGPAAATAIVALDSFVMSLWLRVGTRSPIRSLFNLSSVALAIWTASTLFFWLAGAAPGNLDRLLPLESHLWDLFALATVYFVLNSGLVAIALSFERGSNVFHLWWENFPWLSLSYFGGVSVAALLVSYTRSVDIRAIGIILPLLLISYFTYKTSLGRIEDSKRHVEQVNDLYMSTIESLAMAVDAKDQLTHGHIRRVQVYAVELAKKIGVKDERSLRAIETAALLHDLGKLAIPEHILNKPGKLTTAEFDKMKRHAGIGADLLSSIKFPYPVVPIVRHHHEHWDGTGYPSNVSGTDIPLGARILSVVDCFDALTSDRPYRPRLASDEAFKIIREGRGRMYDPVIVDTFIKTYSEIAPKAVRAGEEARSILPPEELANLTESGASPPFEHIRANVTEAATLVEYRQEILNAHSVKHAVELVTQCLRRLTPATVYAVFMYNFEADVLRCDFTVGDTQKLLEGLTVRVGEKVTGWCAATRRTTVNAEASLDLVKLTGAFDPHLRSTICTPLVYQDKLLGVLTGYSVKREPFMESDRYVFEEIAEALAHHISVANPVNRVSNVVSFRNERV